MSIPGLVHLYTAFAVEATDPDHPAGPFFNNRYEQMTLNFVRDLRVRQQLGTVTSDVNLEDTARLLIATCEGLQIRWLRSADFDMHAEFTKFLATLGIEQSHSDLGADPRRSFDPPEVLV